MAPPTPPELHSAGLGLAPASGLAKHERDALVESLLAAHLESKQPHDMPLSARVAGATSASKQRKPGSHATPARHARAGGAAQPASAVSKASTNSFLATPQQASAPAPRERAPGQRPARRKTRAELQQEAQARFEAEHTFQPKLRARQRASPPRGSVFDRLAAHAEAQREAKQQAAAIQAKAEEDARRAAARMHGSGTAEDLVDRLYSAEEARQQKLRALRAQVASERKEVCTFAPVRPAAAKSDALAGGAGYVPLHERVGAMQRAKDAAAHAARVEALRGDENLRFAPAICEKSARLAAERAAGDGARSENSSTIAQPVEDRLMAAGAAQAAALRAAQAQKLTADGQRAQPEANAVSRQLLDADTDLAGAGFYTRQRVLARRAAERSSQTKFQLQQASECTFQPKTADPDRVLAQRNPERLLEGPEQRVQRLSQRDARRMAALREALAAEEAAKYSFVPKINKVSAMVGVARTPDQHLAEAAQRRAAQEAAAQQLPEREAKECTFQPRTANPDAVLAQAKHQPWRLAAGLDLPGLSSRVEAWEARRAARRAAAAAAQEYEELADCTFVPATLENGRAGRKAAQPTGPVPVSGLASHMRRSAAAADLQARKKAAEYAAFHVEPAVLMARDDQGVTHAAPFQLATQAPARLERAAVKAAKTKQAVLRSERGVPSNIPRPKSSAAARPPRVPAASAAQQGGQHQSPAFERAVAAAAARAPPMPPADVDALLEELETRARSHAA